jgi:alginate O-acetyltransferase complex protein AlgI
MAIGVARALGYDFPENFNHPYLASSPSDFWRRWHISLSTCMRDYVYIPLGGNRRGAFRTQLNRMLTMLLGGLWHGAAWTFVFWGAFHGTVLLVGRWAQTVWNPRRLSPVSRAAGRAVGWLTTMLAVVIGWVFFRSAEGGFPQAMRILDRMFLHPGGTPWYNGFVVFAIVLMGVAHSLHATRFAHWRQLSAARLSTPVLLFLMLWLVLVFAPQGFTPFIYFRF